MKEITVINTGKKVEIEKTYSLLEFFEKFGDRMKIAIVEHMDNIVFDSYFKIKESFLMNNKGLYLQLKTDNSEEDILIYQEEDMFVSIIKPKDREIAIFYKKIADNLYFKLISISLK